MKKKIEFNFKNIIILILVICILSSVSSYLSTSYALAENDYPIHSEKVEYTDKFNLGATNVQAAINGTCIKFNEKLDELRESMYPIGSIYLSTNLSTASAVESMLGGTWEVYGKGKNLVGVDTENEQYKTSNIEGGNNFVTLSASQIPSLNILGTTKPEKSGSTGSGYSIDNKKEIKTTNTTGAHKHTPTINGLSADVGIWYASGNSRSGVNWGSNSPARDYVMSTTSDGEHYHTYEDYYTNNISGVAAHTHLIPSLSVNASYTNSNVSSINVQDEYITVYMYKRTA